MASKTKWTYFLVPRSVWDCHLTPNRNGQDDVEGRGQASIPVPFVMSGFGTSWFPPFVKQSRHVKPCHPEPILTALVID